MGKNSKKQILWADTLNSEIPYFGCGNSPDYSKPDLKYFRYQRDNRGYDDTELYGLSCNIAQYYMWLYDNGKISTENVKNVRLYHYFIDYLFYVFDYGDEDSIHYRPSYHKIDSATVQSFWKADDKKSDKKFLKDFCLSKESEPLLRYIYPRLHKFHKSGISGEYMNPNLFNDMGELYYGKCKQEKDISLIKFSIDILLNGDILKLQTHHAKEFDKGLNLFVDKFWNLSC